MSTQENSSETRDVKNYFCHSCSNNFRKAPDQDFICPSCEDGFIEELPENSSNMSQNDSDDHDDFTMRGVFSDLVPFQGGNNNSTPYMRIANDILGPIISGSLGGIASTSGDPDGSSTSRRRGAGQRRTGPINFEDLLQEILVSITDGASAGRAPLFFMGNPADYAWGREGLDTIVTQLLNQMDNAGPPPLEQEKIDEIPQCEIVQEQVDAKLQCSVCWEDFQLKESVRQLPCSHVYHETCILPWLKLHGTCPVCRKSLVPEEEGNSNAAAQVANQLRLSIGQQQASTSQEGNSSTTDSNPNENTAGNSSSRRLDDVDYEFD